MKKLYPDSKVEVHGIEAKYYNFLLNLITLGHYNPFIKKVIKAMDIEENDKILDLGCGSGENDIFMAKYLKKGFIIGLDVTDDMIKQFKKKTNKYKNIFFLKHRIDEPFSIFSDTNGQFSLNGDNKILFNKIFISFVLHGLPQKSRIEVIKNAYNNLKNQGIFFILDYNQKPLSQSPKIFQFFFKKIECKYAFDFLNQNLSEDISQIGFKKIEKKLFYRGSIALYKIYK